MTTPEEPAEATTGPAVDTADTAEPAAPEAPAEPAAEDKQAEPRNGARPRRKRTQAKAASGDAGQAAALPLDIPATEDDGTGRFPDLSEDDALHSALEALLLVVDSPAEVEDLADALSQPVRRVRAALRTMAAQYQERNRGIDLRDAGGGWRFYTRDQYAPFVEKLLHDGQRAKLTRAALESLAVIAYRQPVTRARVAAVRGVNVDGVIRTLLVRGLIEETGTDKETGGILYRTTELFLERLGLASLEDLPPIAPLLPEVDAIDDV